MNDIPLIDTERRKLSDWSFLDHFVILVLSVLYSPEASIDSNIFSLSKYIDVSDGCFISFDIFQFSLFFINNMMNKNLVYINLK